MKLVCVLLLATLMGHQPQCSPAGARRGLQGPPPAAAEDARFVLLAPRSPNF
ncbi:hypothetical protein M8312_09190 [Sphingomonas sp. KRR8]|uniref:hypothetical protein n=1 Tax=Sphingomonas sp. KRR8 TaxID=2942996 RepID=UPI00202086D2|nr:hypothetical protein [Sphingomonas sp. KRR8]URD59977.1 hypothetical protein M8312_09190 [Sphingomonas sp. KRR8]